MAQGGESQTSSTGWVKLVDKELTNLKPGTNLYVVAGIDSQFRADTQTRHYLTLQQRHGVRLGALCLGPYILAQVGLLTDHHCAEHSESYPLFWEKFSGVRMSEDVFCAQRLPYTTSGGTEGADLMLHLIKERYGADFSSRIADQLVLPRVRTVGDVQRVPNHVRFGTRNRIHLQTLEFMAANIEKPFTTPQIAKMIGVSVRQVESASRCPAPILWATFAHGFWDGRAHVTRIDSASKAVPTKRRPRN